MPKFAPTLIRLRNQYVKTKFKVTKLWKRLTFKKTGFAGIDLGHG